MSETSSSSIADPGSCLFDARWDNSHVGDAASAQPANLCVTGELDNMSAPVLHRTWDAAVRSIAHDVQVDLEGVSFCNVAGLHVLAAILSSSRDRGLAMTMYVQPRLSWLMRLVGLPVEDLAELVVVRRAPVHLAEVTGGAAFGGVA